MRSTNMSDVTPDKKKELREEMARLEGKFAQRRVERERSRKRLNEIVRELRELSGRA